MDNEPDLDEYVQESDNDCVVENNHTNKIIELIFFTEKQWGNDEDTSNPSGNNFKSKLPEFKKSEDTLKKVIRKGSAKLIGNAKTYAGEVKRKGTGTEVKIKITDPKGEGEVVLTFWSPNTKTKEVTIQINGKKGSDKRFVILFAHFFVRDVIERLLKGHQVEDIFEKGDAKVACTVCSKLFLKESTLKLHMKSHILCNKCVKCFKN